MSGTRAPAETSEIVAFMCDCDAHPERPKSIQRIETHISWLFVTDHFVYKLKKPVRFDFLDFSSPELRHQACLEEVRLNCRLSPDVYLGTLPITRNERGKLEIAGDGEAVDWVVQMRRLPIDQAFDHRLYLGLVTPEDERAIADCLAAFYARLSKERIPPNQYREGLERHVRANAAECFACFARFERARIRQIVGQQLRYLFMAARFVQLRAAEGRIVDGHGDLRPEHVFLESPPAIIDCIEFSADLRRVDVLDDLSFLAMECDRLGHSQVGARIIAACQAALGDVVHLPLLNFYKSYRALVRAKVLLLRAAQRSECLQHQLFHQAHQYIDWAERYAASLGGPLLIVVGGLMGTGKSTLAREIARSIGAECISTDQIRRGLYCPSETPAAYGEQTYEINRRARVYGDLFSRSANALDRSLSVVLDGTFLTTDLRNRANSIAHRHGGTAIYVDCKCPRNVALARLASRTAAGGSESEGRPELFDRQAAEQEPPDSRVPYVALDTTLTLAEQLRQVSCILASQFVGIATE